jgi:two-component system sensor histidine kinase TtrS
MRTTFLIISLAALLPLSTSIGLADIRIGILAKRGPEVVEQRWSALGQYLANKMGEKVTFVPLKFTEVMDWTWNNYDQFVFANSWFYVRAKVRRGAKALVTVKNKGSGVLFGGVIFAKKESGIDRLTALRGKVLMCPKFSSAGGWIFQKGVMLKEGIDPEKDCKRLLEGKTHDAVVVAVADGKADVGTVRTNVLERMSEEGKIDVNTFTILHAVQHADFPEKCSTPLYPTWPIASLKNTPPDRAAKLKDALLSIPQNHPALEPCKVERFVEALNYDPLEQLLIFLKAPPFRRR